MRIYRMFMMSFIAAVCLCSTGMAATSQRVLSAAISAATMADTGVQNRTPSTHDKNTNISAMSRTTVVPGVKSRATTSKNMPGRKLNISPATTTQISPPAKTARNAVVARVPTKSVSNRNMNAAIRPTVSARAATNSTAPNAALQSMLDAADANSRCLESYTQCMDNYCNVLDADLGRCSCSGDITQFSKVSDALSATNVELQNIVKKISYIGLSADEITAMYTQTAAESVMGTIQDTSQTKSDLEAIKGMLVDVKSQSNTSVTNSNDISGLLNLDLTQNNFDAASILGNIGATNSSPLSNQRGEQLYKSAAARCKSSVLKNCIDADPDVIESQYKTEISRACAAYGKALQEKNDQARRMINNAERVLQTARLKVQTEKDSYDLRGCVSALDSCMRDDFVCGSDYSHCMDATGRYFVSGQLVSGASESAIMTGVWGVSEPGGDANFIKSNLTSGNIANLIAKIGNPIRHDGLCSNVLNKCQKQWRDGKSDSYDTTNGVVLAYLGDVIPKIVARQRELINDFRSDCVSAVNTCIAKQGTQTVMQPRSKQHIIGDLLAAKVGACRATIDMCANIMDMTDKQILEQYVKTNVCASYDTEVDVCDNDYVFKITTADMPANTTFSFDMSAQGTFTVDWGDGSVEQIVRKDTNSKTYSHKYASAGARVLWFGGVATEYASSGSVIRFGNEYITQLNGSLGAMFPKTVNSTNKPSYANAFAGCTSLTDVPENLFSGSISGAREMMFHETFSGCTSLTSVPEKLFDGISGAANGMFQRTFQGCTSLTTVPEKLFNGISGAATNMFYGTFHGCTNLTTVPAKLFNGISGAANNMFVYTFALCSNLGKIPRGLFNGVSDSGSANYMFRGTFIRCSKLTGPSAQILVSNGTGKQYVYLYDVFGKREAVGLSCYSESTGLTDYANIPDGWK